MNVALDDYWVIAFCYHSTADENCYWFVNSILNFFLCFAFCDGFWSFRCVSFIKDAVRLTLYS